MWVRQLAVALALLSAGACARQDANNKTGPGEQPAGPAVNKKNGPAMTDTSKATRVRLELIRELAGRTDAFLASSRKGSTWASATPDAIQLWDGDQPATSARLEDADGYQIEALGFSADGARLAASPAVFDVSSAKLNELPGLRDAFGQGLNPLDNAGADERYRVSAAAWSPTLDELVVAVEYREPMTARGKKSPPRTLPRNRLLVFDDKLVMKKDLDPDDSVVGWFAVAVDDRFAVAIGDRVVVWDRKGYTKLATLETPERPGQTLRLSPDGKRVAVIGERVWLWRTDTWKLEHSWQAHESHGQALAFHPSAPILASGDADGSVKLWRLTDAAPPALLAEQKVGKLVRAIAFAAEGNRLIVADNDSESATRIFGLTYE